MLVGANYLFRQTIMSEKNVKPITNLKQEIERRHHGRASSDKVHLPQEFILPGDEDLSAVGCLPWKIHGSEFDGFKFG